MFQTRKALDTLVPTAQGIKELKNKKGALDPSREEVLGFKFKPGQIAKDLVTGKEVRVLAAERGDYAIKKRGDTEAE